jgi:hypothetical protein
LDWKIFEEAGKYAGLAGIALIVLLYIIRQILKLPIFDKIGGRGTQLTINNIINKVFWVTIAALVAWLVIGLFGKDAGQSGDLTGPVATFGAQSIQVSDLPSGVTDPVSDDSPDEQTKQLQQRSSLALNGTTLVIGAPGEGRTVTIGCNTLRMTNGARIITNGNRLVIVCLKTLFGDNSGIASFPPGMPKAGAGASGLAGGSVRIATVQSFSGELRVSLLGQDGGDGAAGAPGNPGQTGERGANSVQGFPGCSSGGQDGKPGGQGTRGANGGIGGTGGDGGELILEDKAAKNFRHVEFRGTGGKGGAGGTPGPGGSGGPGGEGGSGGGSCRGGHGGISGPGGPSGDPGSTGSDGKPGKRTP